jgi:hypothetical protein
MGEVRGMHEMQSRQVQDFVNNSGKSDIHRDQKYPLADSIADDGRAWHMLLQTAAGWHRRIARIAILVAQIPA